MNHACCQAVKTAVQACETSSHGTRRNARSQDLELEVQRLRSELEYRSRFTDSLQHFLERISCADPVKTYNSIISNFEGAAAIGTRLVMVFDESANELI
jgi:hypothetical protein